jgi:ribose-phosphate pyrophosphokinase
MFSTPEQLSDEQKQQTVLVANHSHPHLAQEVASIMGIPLSPVDVRIFPNGEVYTRYTESVRGKDVVILSTGVSGTRDESGAVWSQNDNIQSVLHLVDGARGSSAHKIYVVEAHLPYARGDRMALPRESVGARVHIRTLEAMGMSALVAVDLHSKQIQAITDRPFDNLEAMPIISSELGKIVIEPAKYIFVAPDEGRLKESLQYGRVHGTSVDFLAKQRDPSNSSEITRTHRLTTVGGLTCILVDDMIDTAGTLVSAARSLKQDSGAKEVIAAATHGLFSGKALERLASDDVDRIIVTDTLPVEMAKKHLGDKLTVLPIAPLIGRALFEILSGGSVSRLFSNK